MSDIQENLWNFWPWMKHGDLSYWMHKELACHLEMVDGRAILKSWDMLFQLFENRIQNLKFNSNFLSSAFVKSRLNKSAKRLPRTHP